MVVTVDVCALVAAVIVWVGSGCCRRTVCLLVVPAPMALPEATAFCPQCNNMVWVVGVFVFLPAWLHAALELPTTERPLTPWPMWRQWFMACGGMPFPLG